MNRRPLAELGLATALLAMVATLTTWVPASASGVDPAGSCSTAERGRRLVTTVEWLSGETTPIYDMRVGERFFPGRLDVVSPARRPGKIVRKCRVRDDGVVVLRTTGGARVEVAQPVGPRMPHPAAVGAWAGPVSFHSTASADWRVAEAVAAWNVAMPPGRQLSIQASPCASSSCVSITTAPTLTQPNWYGEAERSPIEGVMTACSIRVADHVDIKDRPAVMAHEIGHCLGLEHWEYRGSVMYPHPASAWTDLPSDYDIDWLGGK